MRTSELRRQQREFAQARVNGIKSKIQKRKDALKTDEVKVNEAKTAEIKAEIVTLKEDLVVAKAKLAEIA